jgi:hypothetical protein
MGFLFGTAISRFRGKWIEDGGVGQILPVAREFQSVALVTLHGHRALVEELLQDSGLLWSPIYGVIVVADTFVRGSSSSLPTGTIGEQREPKVLIFDRISPYYLDCR